MSSRRCSRSVGGWLRSALATGLWLGLAVHPLAVAAQSRNGANSKDLAKVTAVRFWSSGDVTRVAIEVSSEFTFKYNRLSNPERLFFDLAGTVPSLSDRGIHTIAVNDAMLKQIRVAEKEPGVTRIVLDMVQTAVVTSSQLSNPSRLVVELRLKDNAAPASTPDITRSQPIVEPERSAPAAANRGVVPESPRAESPRDVASESPKDAIAIEVRPKHVTGRTFVPPVIARKNVKLETITAPQIKLPLLTLSVNVTSATYAKNLPVLSAPAAPTPTVAKAVTPDFTHEAIAVASEVTRDAPKETSPKETSPKEAKVPNVAARVSPSARATARAAELSPEPLPAKRGTVTGDRSLTRALGLKLGRVVLDPGHGGHDQGTHGPSGYTEKDLALDVAQRLGALIEQRLGSEVVFTRSDDTFIPLEERTRIANEHKADLFLSIHANSSPYRAAAGVETYVLNFTTSKTAMDLASRENAGSQKSIYDLQELLQKIALRDKIGESLEFASRLQTSLSSLSAHSNENAKNRGIKRAPFVVLIGATMPSVLAEIGFLTNPSDETLLRTPEHRQKIAESLYKGIAAYADSLSRFQVASGASRTRRTVDTKP